MKVQLLTDDSTKLLKFQKRLAAIDAEIAVREASLSNLITLREAITRSHGALRSNQDEALDPIRRREGSILNFAQIVFIGYTLLLRTNSFSYHHSFDNGLGYAKGAGIF